MLMIHLLFISIISPIFSFALYSEETRVGKGGAAQLQTVNATVVGSIPTPRNKLFSFLNSGWNTMRSAVLSSAS